MLSQLEIDTENRLCIWRIGGKTNYQALCDGYRERFAHPDWAPDLLSLSVLTKLGLGSFTPDMAVHFAQFIAECDREFGRTAPRAALVCEEETARALLFYWEKMGSQVIGRSERIFTHESEARRWLLTEEENAA